MDEPEPPQPQADPTDPSSDLAPRGYYEARLDLLLAEEPQVNPDFAQWFASTALPTSGSVPDPQGTVVRFNQWDEGGPQPADSGENDLDVTLRYTEAVTVRLLIEDKVWAPFQPD